MSKCYLTSYRMSSSQCILTNQKTEAANLEHVQRRCGLARGQVICVEFCKALPFHHDCTMIQANCQVEIRLIINISAAGWRRVLQGTTGYTRFGWPRFWAQGLGLTCRGPNRVPNGGCGDSFLSGLWPFRLSNTPRVAGRTGPYVGLGARWGFGTTCCNSDGATGRPGQQPGHL